MPRLIQSVPKYRRHRASGQALVEINGRRHYLGPHGTKASKLEYDRLITEWLSSGRSTAFGILEQAISVVELLVAYLEHARIYYGDHSRSEYANMRYALRPLRDLYGLQFACEFGPMQLKAVREKFIAAGNSRTYIKQQVRRISRVFRWGAAEALIPSNVPQGFTKGRAFGGWAVLSGDSHGLPDQVKFRFPHQLAKIVVGHGGYLLQIVWHNVFVPCFIGYLSQIGGNWDKFGACLIKVAVGASEGHPRRQPLCTKPLDRTAAAACAKWLLADGFFLLG
jgi:hypothetical protein